MEHIAALRQLDVEAFPVRLPSQLKGLNGLVIPGGESTTIGSLMREYALADDLNRLITEGLPVFGTCAGLVLLAKKIVGPDQPSLGVMNIQVRRNAYGRQVDSFEADLEVPPLGAPPFRGVFIRAPRIERVGKGVEVLATLSDGSPVAAREHNLVATVFHPELTEDVRFHEYFLTMVDGKFKAKAG